MMTDIKLSEEKRPGILFKEKALWGPVGLFKRYRKFWEDLKSSEEGDGDKHILFPCGRELSYNNKIERLKAF